MSNAAVLPATELKNRKEKKNKNKFSILLESVIIDMICRYNEFFNNFVQPSGYSLRPQILFKSLDIS